MTTYRCCYLCKQRRPEGETELTGYTVPSALRGGVVKGVDRYVRMCRLRYGCKQ